MGLGPTLHARPRRAVSTWPALAAGVILFLLLVGPVASSAVDQAAEGSAASAADSLLAAPDVGPGGPVLVIGSTANPFGQYYAEILRTEGLNAFSVTDISLVTPALLADYDVAILGEITLTPSEATTLSSWVETGGNLIAMRPDEQLADLLGLTDTGASLGDAYLRVDTGTPAGTGIVGDTIQFHGTADRYTLNGAAAVATLYSDASSPTSNPAVTLRSVGTSGGEAAAFTFDLARSVALTRQGNPAWSGQERDGQVGIRANDLFYPDWVNLDKVAIPQADEQQRLLANLIETMNADRKPLPRFWYFPGGEKAVVIMTGDDHGSGSPTGRFEQFKAQDPPNCSVDDWECIRATDYVYTGSPISDAQAAAYTAEGFEVALHVNTGCTAPWTPTELDAIFSADLADFGSTFTSIPAPATNRTHCISWNDYVSQPKVELSHGIRLDTNYYYWPPQWILDRPGMFTGSGMPMRFADVDGTLIDVYQATTQMTDESGQTYPATVNALLDRALGPEGYYGAFTANMHTDNLFSAGADAIVASAKARSVPVVSARQMLTWLDGRNASSFGSLAWGDDTLTFDIDVGAGANGLQAMLPTGGPSGGLSALARDGSPVAFAKQRIKGIEYAVFAAAPGSYDAVYAAAPNGAPTAADDTYSIDEDSVLSVPAPGVLGNDSDPNAGDQLTAVQASNPQHGQLALAADGSFTYTPVADYAGPDSFTYRASDGTAESAAATVTITVADQPEGLTDTTTAHFGAGTLDQSLYLGQDGDGELLLLPTVGTEFDGSSLPGDWTSGVWGGGGTASVALGALAVDGAFAGTGALFGPGRALEFVAAFGPASFQHVGFGVDYNNSPNWAMLSTGTTGGAALIARTNANGTTTETTLTGVAVTVPHRFRIEWGADNTIAYFVDGTLVATHAVAPGTFGSEMRPLASDFAVGGASLSVDWLRLTPYAGAGTFASRVFDAGQTTGWQSLSWVAQVPSSTSVTMSVRTGDSGVPDGTWSSWNPIPASGDPVGATSRYLQYRAELATAAPDHTPELEQVTATTGQVEPNEPPAAVDDAYSMDEDSVLTVPAPGVLGNDSDPNAGDQLSAVQASDTQHGQLALAADGSFTYTPVADYAGPDSFTYRASDGTAESGAATVAITVAPQPEGLTDTTVAHFGAGTLDQSLYLGQDGDGELLLLPTVGTEFDGSSLPVGWSWAPWTGGTATVGGGTLVVDGARANVDALYASGRTLEFPATFGSEPFQHAGFGTDLNDQPWAIFSTGGGSLPTGLYARTFANGVMTNTALAGVTPTAPHRYRIEWRADEVAYFVDGTLVATHSGTIAQSMRPIVSDLVNGGAQISVDWLRMSPYSSAGTFLSRVLDAGQAVAWEALTWTAETPVGTAVTFSVRTGNTETPDDGWSSWKPLSGSGDAVGLAGRYLQYRAVFETGDPELTPLLAEVTATYGDAPPNQPPLVVDDAYSVDEDGQLSVTSGDGVLANDSDPDDDPLSAVLVSGTAHGQLTLNPDGSFTYTPAADYHGPDSFTYAADDGTATSGNATVGITVGPVNDAPVCNDLALVTDEDTPASIDPDCSDVDGDSLTYEIASPAGNGTASVSGANLHYQPAADYNGADSFTYRANDGAADSAAATVDVTVNAVNDAPTAGTVSIAPTSPTTNQTLTATPAGFADVDGDELTYHYKWLRNGVAIPGATDGTLDLSQAGNGDKGDSVGVEVYATDAGGGTSGTATANVTVANSKPTIDVSNATAAGDYSDAIVPFTVTATDADGDPLTFGQGTPGLPAALALSDHGDGTATVAGVLDTASGTYQPVLAVSDGTDTDEGTATIVVAPEDAQIAYSGDTIALVGRTLNLRATVLDSASTGYAGHDPEPATSATVGDIGRMWVAFDLYSDCGSAETPVRTVYARVADTGTVGDGVGTAAGTVASSVEALYCVVTRLVEGDGTHAPNPWYAGDPATATVAFSQSTGQFVLGAGWLPDPTGSKGTLALTARYGKKGTPQGTMIYFWSGLYGGVPATFIVKSTSLSALGFQGTAYPASATLEGKTTIQINRASNGARLYRDANASFTATALDTNGVGSDTFMLKVYDKNGVLYKAVPTTPLEGGNVVVHSKK